MSQTLNVMGAGEAAEALGVHPVTLSRLIREGQLVPDATLRCGPVFRTQTVERLKKKRDAS